MFIAIEGPDGSGKGIQVEKLHQRFLSKNILSHKISFPRYETPTGKIVKKYLNGEFGPADEVHPLVASMFYALDRQAAVPDLSQWLENGQNVVSDRYVASNFGHQGGKISDLNERKKLITQLADIEFKVLGIPEPSVNIILSVPVKVSLDLLCKRAKEGRALDQHEQEGHLIRAHETYHLLPKWFPFHYKIINCYENGRLLSPNVVHEKIWEELKI
ncbi:MAG: hypothetical protein AAB847_00175 [Patescibacteria group bacterium]